MEWVKVAISLIVIGALAVPVQADEVATIYRGYTVGSFDSPCTFGGAGTCVAIPTAADFVRVDLFQEGPVLPVFQGIGLPDPDAAQQVSATVSVLDGNGNVVNWGGVPMRFDICGGKGINFDSSAGSDFRHPAAQYVRVEFRSGYGEPGQPGLHETPVGNLPYQVPAGVHDCSQRSHLYANGSDAVNGELKLRFDDAFACTGDLPESAYC